MPSIATKPKRRNFYKHLNINLKQTKRMKKLFTLLTLTLLSIGAAWAGTEVSPEGGSSNASVNGTSFSINGTTNAGSGTKISPMSGKGIKVRKSTPLVMTVNEGFRINSVTVYAASNDNSKTFQIASIEVDGKEYVPTGKTMPITCVQKNASTATTIEITNIAATDNIKFNFDGTNSQGIMEFHVDYTQTEVIVQEISSVTLNGSAISAEDLATLKTDKALTIDGKSLNGIGALEVELSSGSTTVTKAISGTTATYTFTINSTDTYTVTVNGLTGSYSEAGSVVYYSKGNSEVEGANTKSVTANGITFTMTDASKTFQYGVGSVTMSGNKYAPLKLSTGSAVNVTFPEGKVATKVIVYGWSQSGNGKLTAFKESEDAEEKAIDVTDDVFFATNTAGDTYPSVYEYTLDNWESLYFTAAGSASQPFVVMDFVLADKTAPIVTGTEVTFDFVANEWNHTLSTALNPDAGNIDELTKDDIKLVLKQAQGSNPSRYYTGPQLRVFNKNIIKVMAPEGKAIKGIEFTANGTYYGLTATNGTLDGTTWTGNTTCAKFTATKTNQLTKMVVTIDDADESTSSMAEPDETVFIDFNDPTIHDEFNVSGYVYLTEDIVLSDGHRDSNDAIDGENRVTTTIPYIPDVVNSKQNYIRLSGMNVSLYLRGGKVVFKTSSDKVFKTIKMTASAFMATMNGETVTNTQINSEEGWHGNSNVVEMEVTGGTNITNITFVISDEPWNETETVEVTVGSAGFATFCSDKDLDFTESSIAAYTATVSGKDITFTKINKVPAGTGVLLYAEGGATEAVPVADEADAVNGNAFVAATSAMTGDDLVADGAYILANGTDGIGFYKAGSGASLAAGKAYLKATAGARIVMPNGVVTGISNTLTENEESKVVYNLQGQRIATPKKGLNIVNGKKLIVK